MKMDLREQPSDCVAKWSETAEAICGSSIDNPVSHGAVTNFAAPLEEVAPVDCCSESHSCSPATKKYKSNKGSSICTNVAEQAPSTSSALDSYNHIISLIGADLQSVETMVNPPAYNDLDICMTEEETVVNTQRTNTVHAAGSLVKMPRASHSALPEERHYSLILSEDEDEDYNYYSSVTNTVHQSGVENLNPAENSSRTYVSLSNEELDDAIDKTKNANWVNNVLKKAKPSYTFNLTYELMRRENGLSRDGRRSLHSSLVSGFCSSRQVVERMQLSGCLQKHQYSVDCLNFDRSGKLLCSGGPDHSIIVWDWAQKKTKMVFDMGHLILYTKFIDSSAHLDIVSADISGDVRRIVIPSAGGNPEVTLLYRHEGAVYKIVTNPFNSLEVFSVGEDGRIRFRDLRSNDPASSICKVKRKNVNRRVNLFSIAHHPSSPEICVSGTDKYVRVYDRRNMTKTVYDMLPSHLAETSYLEVSGVAYNSTGTEVLASYNVDDMYLFNNVEYKTGDYLHRYTGHCNHITIAKGVNFFGPNSDYVITGSDCGNIFFWDKDTEAVVNCLPCDSKYVSSVEPHPKIPVLAAAGFEHNIKIFAPGSHTHSPDFSKLEANVKHNVRYWTDKKRWLDQSRAVIKLRQLVMSSGSQQGVAMVNYTQ